MVMNLTRHLDARVFDTRVGVLEWTGAYVDAIDPARVVRPRIGQGWVHYPSPSTPAAILTGIPMAPLQQLDLMWQFKPHILVSLTKSMNIAARFAVAAYGRRRVRWIAREGNNTQAVIDWEKTTMLDRALMVGLIRRTYRAADRVVAISHGVAAGLSRQIGVPESHIVVIPNGVDIEEVRRRAREEVPVPPRFIVAAGRFVQQKGFDTLLQAFAKSATRTDVSLVILGDGPDRRSLEQASVALGVRDRVLMPGTVANPWAYVARAEAFVLSSRWEGFANVIVEAMACGTPVIVTDCDYGPREIVRHEENGLVVPVDDARGLSEAILRLLGDPALARRLAAGGLERAASLHVGRAAAAYADLFRQLLSKPA